MSKVKHKEYMVLRKFLRWTNSLKLRLILFPLGQESKAQRECVLPDSKQFEMDPALRNFILHTNTNVQGVLHTNTNVQGLSWRGVHLP
jgi:hypothetical protein